MKKVEELLLPRYKVIADYPGTQYSVGEILPVIGTEMYTKGRTEFLSSYPHLFQPLPWWSDREVEDMPEYVKCVNTPDQIIKASEVLKVTWQAADWGKSDEHVVLPYTNCFLPATCEEYELFKQKEK